MRIGVLPVFATLVFCQACGTRERPVSEVKSGVVEFMRTVADQVTRQGPAAWRDYFEDAPSFFMAVDGRLQYADGASAQADIPNLTRAIPAIELQWGDGARVDVLSSDAALVAAPWHEVLTLAGGNRLDERGYFTALVERRGGKWQFRNAHWSTARDQGSGK